MAQTFDPLREARGFMHSRVILTAAELDLFTWLDGRTASSAEIAGGLGVDERALARVLDVLAGLGLVTKAEGRYGLSPASAALSDRHAAGVRASLLHAAQLWNSWSSLTDTVRSGKPPARGPSGGRSQEATRAFIGAMEVASRERAEALARGYDTAGFSELLDIGGGPATYSIAFLRRNAGLRAVVFDLPVVIPLADERVAGAGLGDRIRLVPGDFYQDELPGGSDLALLSAIIHQNSRTENQELFRKIHRALAPGGALLIRDHIMEPDRVHPAAGALFAINMLMNTRGGGTYTFAEVEEDLTAAGFGEVKLVRRGENMDCLVEAGKPAP